MAVEAPEETVRLIRVAGNLDRAAAAGLLRLVDAQMELLEAGRHRVTDLIVDLDHVCSFEPGGLEAARHARHSTAGHGVRIHLVGCSRRSHLLPLRARQVLGEFSTFPTVEVALAELAGHTAAGVPPLIGTDRPSTLELDLGRPRGLSPVPAPPPLSAQLDPVGGGEKALPAPRPSSEQEPSESRFPRTDAASVR